MTSYYKFAIFLHLKIKDPSSYWYSNNEILVANYLISRGKHYST
jgi:hypothetical protein